MPLELNGATRERDDKRTTGVGAPAWLGIFGAHDAFAPQVRE